ncbi:MAG: hypothetical protein LBK58_03000 [Prevotellaceae bacterium]|jgi:hypothetical protein|nr:hypothetical protein [Prevotellaceae bacterium]
MAKKKHVRKKKYVNVAEQQKLQEAQYRNFFMDKLQKLCRQIGSETLFRQIPATEKILLYVFRGAPLKVVAAEGAKIHKRLMEVLRKTIKLQQTSMTLEVVKGSGQTMTYADYLLVGMSLEHHACDTELTYTGKEQLDKYAELRDEREDAYEKGILNICGYACWIFDDIGKKYLHTYKLDTTALYFESSFKIPQDNTLSRRNVEKVLSQDFRLHQKITIGTYPLETRKVFVSGETHSAVQVGFLFYTNDEPKFHHFTLSPDEMKMKINSPFSKLGFPVYIQQHALDRMRERLGLVIPAFYTSVLVLALIRKDVIPIAKNRRLITCYTNELKIGYFVAEVVDSVVLIRTFLLLTNSGTPEGDRLSQLTGLQAEDRKYLSIDNLQGLANSDIAQNGDICKLFRDAGCGSILELCEKMNNNPEMMWLLDPSQPKNIISDLIAEYMKPNTDDDDNEDDDDGE